MVATEECCRVVGSRSPRNPSRNVVARENNRPANHDTKCRNQIAGHNVGVGRMRYRYESLMGEKEAEVLQTAAEFGAALSTSNEEAPSGRVFSNGRPRMVSERVR